MEPIIKISNLYKDFIVDGKIFHALQNVNLEVMEKDIYGIIGLSGAGKSTLIRCINLLEVPTSGKISFLDEVLFDDDKKETKKINECRQKMGMIFQNFNLFEQFSRIPLFTPCNMENRCNSYSNKQNTNLIRTKLYDYRF